MNRLDLAAIRESADAAHTDFLSACAPVLESDSALWLRITDAAREMTITHAHRLIAVGENARHMAAVEARPA